MNKEERSRKYIEAVNNNPNLELKGKNNLYTSLNGNMFTMFSKEGQVGIRLPKQQQENLIKNGPFDVLMSYGAVMRGYVVVPDKVLENKTEMLKLLNDSFEYAKSLKPKPTKKP